MDEKRKEKERLVVESLEEIRDKGYTKERTTKDNDKKATTKRYAKKI